MKSHCFIVGLVMLALCCTPSLASTIFVDDFDGITLDTNNWSVSGTGVVSVSDSNATLDVPSGDWAFSQIDSVSTWTADTDLYYSFTIGAVPLGNYNIMQIFEGTAQVGYVAFRNDLGGGWKFDVREGASGSATYRSDNAQTLDIGDIITLKLGPDGSAAYKNGVMFDSTSIVPQGTLMIDAQCWREPGGVASQTFDQIEVSTAAPVPEPSTLVLSILCLLCLISCGKLSRK